MTWLLLFVVVLGLFLFRLLSGRFAGNEQLLFVVVLGLLFLDWRAGRAVALLREGIELLRQLRNAANRSEQDALEREAEAIKQGAGGGRQAPPSPR